MIKTLSGSFAVFACTFCCCIYSFTGSSLPGHLKTVEIPLFTNQSLQSDVADAITRELSSQIVAGNLLRVVQHDGDAAIAGIVTSYTNAPFTFSAAETRQVSVQQYVVRITASVEFTDNKTGSAIYKGTVTGEGIYDLQSQIEQTGRQKAITDLVQRILQHSVQSW